MWRAGDQVGDPMWQGHAPMGGIFFSKMNCGIASSYVYNIHNYIYILSYKYMDKFTQPFRAA